MLEAGVLSTELNVDASRWQHGNLDKCERSQVNHTKACHVHHCHHVLIALILAKVRRPLPLHFSVCCKKQGSMTKQATLSTLCIVFVEKGMSHAPCSRVNDIRP